MKNEFEYLNDVKVDFSKYKKEELTESEKKKMMEAVVGKQKKTAFKKMAVIAASAAVVVALSITAYASGLVDNIVKSVSTGNTTFYQIDEQNVKAKIPDCLTGLVFDENGNAVTLYEDGKQYYDEDGNKIDDLESYERENINVTRIASEGKDTEIIFSDKSTGPLELKSQQGQLVVRNQEEIASYLSFDAKYPTFIPDGFVFDGAYIMTNGESKSDFVFLYYKNSESGKWLVINERAINDDIEFVMSTDGELKETAINGNKAAVCDNQSITWETDGISIGVSGRGVVSYDELVKICESVK